MTWLQVKLTGALGRRAAVTILLPVALFAGSCKRKTAAAPPPPPEVRVTPVRQQNTPIVREWVGSIDGLVNASIRAQVSGYLLKQDYQEGSLVKTGDLLFEIDDRPFVAALDRARGQLAQAEAQLGKTELDVKRYTPLAAKNAISKQELDDAIQANLGAKAAVDAARAAASTAEVDLGFTKVAAPIEGIVGTAKAQIGDLVSPTGGELTAISTIDPVKVYFTPSEQQYLNYVNRRRAMGADPRNDPGPELQLVLTDGSIFKEKGKILFIDRQVDPRTGTIRVTATFPNPELVLRPGMFARVRAATQIRTNAVTVPQKAVSELQGKYFVAVAGADGKAHVRPVTMGDTVGPNWIVEQGLSAGDRVVVEGLQKVRDGMAVRAVEVSPDAIAQAGSDTNAAQGGADEP